MCCWCPPSYWDVRTKKCYAGWSIILGVAFIVGAIVVPIFLPNRLEGLATAQAKDVLAVPEKSKSAGQFVYEDWLNNDNEKWHPPSYREFYFYNITNTDLAAVVTGKEKLQVEKVGPIAFRKKWQRFPETVEFSANKDRVCYDFGISFEFDADKSMKGLTPDSTLQMLNIPYFGGLVQATVLGDSMGVEGSLQTYLPLMCDLTAEIRPELGKPGPNQWFDNCSTAAANNYLPPFDNPNQCHACLFMNTTIQALLFGAESNALHLLFRETPFSVPNKFFNPDNSQTLFATSAALFHNCSTREECYNEKAFKTSYGLGGACQEFSKRFPSDQFALNLVTPGLCVPPANISNHSTSLKQCQYTGINDDCFTTSFTEEACAESKVQQFSQWMGNTSTELWGHPHPVWGAFDQEPQFHPFVQDEETLSLWIPDVMRSFDIKYESEQQWRGLNLKRFKPVDSIFGINGAAHDSGYGQENTPAGFIDASATTLVKYGVAVPLFLSQPGYEGADLSDPMLTGVDCFVTEDGKKKSCETSGEGIYVDIEPTFGKVVRGNAGAQVNIKLESKYFKFSFGNLNALSPFNNFVNETDLMVPFLIFSDTALAQPGQTNLLENNIVLLDDLPAVPWGLFAVLMVLGGVFVVVGTFFYGRASLKPVPEAPRNYQPLEYEDKKQLTESLLSDAEDSGTLRQSLTDLRKRLTARLSTLSQENAKLAAEKGEEKFRVEATDNTDRLLEQIKRLEESNQRLRFTADAELGQTHES